MGNEERFEPVAKQRPGDQVLRKRREPKRKLRIAPNIPEVFKFLKVIVNETPFVPMITLLAVLWLLFSTTFYYVERGAIGTEITDYSHALWWGIVAMTTMGTAHIPVSGSAQIVGGIWAVLGSIIFYGAIIASVTTYFARRREGQVKQIISTITYNIEHLEKLSSPELEVLKETTVRLIDDELQKHKERGLP
jgi:voltage-gated potassium channel